ncbi:MAG: flavodoxin [Clostridiales bacterium]|nr:flavodoxin [Clostridiales bacterium]
MKNRLTSALLATSLLLTLTLAACGAPASENSAAPTVSPAQSGQTSETDKPTPAETVGTSENAPSETPTASRSNILVVWFSRVGVTPFADGVDASSSASINVRDGELVGNMQYLAEFVAEETGGDLFQIITEKEYPVTYRDTTDLAKEEQSNNERPDLSSHAENMDQYGVIFLGFPNWWGTLPQAVKGFLEEYDFTGKTIVPFCSHEGSGLGRGPQDIAALCPGAELLDGLAVRGSAVSGAQADVQEWLNGLNLGS